MASRDEIERLLNATGRTLNDLPERYPVDKIMAVGRLRGVNIKEAGKTILHQSDVIELLVGALRDALDKQPKWIGVKERMPQPFVSVLAHMPGERPHPTVREGYISSEGIWVAGYFRRESDEVTHWAEMPEPPEEETNETTD